VLGELLGYDARRIDELNGGGAFGKMTGRGAGRECSRMEGQ
jgi:hypothetical protein